MDADRRQTRTTPDMTSEAPAVRLVQTTLERAADAGASDVHLEPIEGAFRVRLRIDGTLQEIGRYPIGLAPAVVSRLKILSRLDIAERRLPQDGRLTFSSSNGGAIDVRVSALPTVYGESIVLRLLRPPSQHLGLAGLGLQAQALDQLRAALAAAHGMVLVTGPTGSGKTTTLYAALREIDAEARNVVTAEDPVEARIAGVNQVQVNEEIGFGFATALRAFLRQDPDVILVGEIRDSITAEIAVRAALTGHVVLSTLHANDAASTITRLIEMGVAPFLVAAALRLVVAQRLVRRCCTECAGGGCTNCRMSGFRGRIGLFETLPLDEGMRDCITRGANLSQLRHEVAERRLTTLAQAARSSTLAGHTTLAEAARSIEGLDQE